MSRCAMSKATRSARNGQEAVRNCSGVGRCSVRCYGPRRVLLVMRAAVPLSETMSPKEYQEAFEKWDYMPGEDGCPFEPKESDWGWYDGRHVALDYSTPGWGND